jgi:hypothetical protein
MSDDPIEDPELNPLSRGSSWRSLNSGVQATLTCAGDAADGRRGSLCDFLAASPQLVRNRTSRYFHYPHSHLSDVHLSRTAVTTLWNKRPNVLLGNKGFIRD